MIKRLAVFTGLVIVAIVVIVLSLPAQTPVNFPKPLSQEPLAMAPGMESAVLAGGCFWGMEGVFERLAGVVDVVSGYSGGEKETAYYDLVSTGTTGHAESIQITYDPAQISYATLLEIFFSIAHDPTQLNFQGPDHGTQYRSVIFYANEQQRKIAQDYIKVLDSSGVYRRKIVTQVTPLAAFYPAEPYHQDFMKKNPDYPYIVAWDRPRVEKLLKEYPGLVK